MAASSTQTKASAAQPGILLQELETQLKEGMLRFPMLASAKVLRKPTKPNSAEQPACQNGQHDRSEFDCYVVDATNQNIMKALSEK